MVSYEVSKSLLYEKYVKCLMGISSNNPHCDPSDHDSFNIIVWNAPHMEDSLLKWASFWQNLPERPTHLVPTNDMAVCWAARMREENVFGNDGLKIMAPPSMYRPKYFLALAFEIAYSLFTVPPRMFRSGHQYCGIQQNEDLSNVAGYFSTPVSK